MQHLGFALGLAVSATLLALLEIQIEGPHGWAASLPTWRWDNRWVRRIWGRPLTGYHLFLDLFILALLHLPFALTLAEWSWAREFTVLSFLLLFFAGEDFLWFALNPAFGLRKFTKEHVWWHASSWWWIMPRDYWLALLIGGGLYWLGMQC
jgi:hypothetical protein